MQLISELLKNKIEQHSPDKNADLTKLGEHDVIVFSNGIAIVRPKYLNLNIRIPEYNNFKLDVLLGSLSINANDMESCPAKNGDGIIYYLKIDYTIPNFLDAIGQIVDVIKRGEDNI